MSLLKLFWFGLVLLRRIRLIIFFFIKYLFNFSNNEVNQILSIEFQYLILTLDLDMLNPKIRRHPIPLLKELAQIITTSFFAFCWAMRQLPQTLKISQNTHINIVHILIILPRYMKIIDLHENLFSALFVFAYWDY